MSARVVEDNVDVEMSGHVGNDLRQNVRNSRARCREKVCPVTLPVFASRTAYNDVVP
jgi:hypothetical protein